MKVFVTGAAAFIGSSALIQSTGSQPTNPPNPPYCSRIPRPERIPRFFAARTSERMPAVEVCVFLINVSA